MGKLTAFIQISLDGFFADASGGMNWAHKDKNDKEWQEFVEGNASGCGTLLFGRITYQMMASYWPSPMAAQNDPVVSQRMNEMRKLVFSRTLDQATWKNTTLLKRDLVSEVRRLKRQSPENLAILGSGSLVTQLAEAGLIDELQLVYCPVSLGHGKQLFADVQHPMAWKLINSRTFANGSLITSYAPAA